LFDLNDQLASANGVAGGRQTIYTAATNPADVGAKFDAVAMPLRSLSDHVLCKLCKLREISMGFVASKR
jgi:hypothetical protein